MHPLIQQDALFRLTPSAHWQTGANAARVRAQPSAAHTTCAPHLQVAQQSQQMKPNFVSHIPPYAHQAPCCKVHRRVHCLLPPRDL